MSCTNEERNASPALACDCKRGRNPHQTSNEETNKEQQTRAAVTINSFHGTDTYVLKGLDVGGVQFIDVDDVEFTSAVSEDPGSPTTACTIQAQGPSAPKKGDQVSGTFHCDNVLGGQLHGDGAYRPPIVNP
jgi:hypothetical protein